MGLYFNRIPKFIRSAIPGILWDQRSNKNIIYLTFDDGPHPDVTPEVLDILENYQAQATFFCLGQQLEKYPDLAMQMIKRGHKIGNHTYSHLNGWRTPVSQYLEDVELCQSIMNKLGLPDYFLFRPPYGKISLQQFLKLRSKYYIVLWSYMTGDFDPNLTVKLLKDRVMKCVNGGDIVVFHDGENTINSLPNHLPEILNHFSQQGFEFSVL